MDIKKFRGITKKIPQVKSVSGYIRFSLSLSPSAEQSIPSAYKGISRPIKSYLNFPRAIKEKLDSRRLKAICFRAISIAYIRLSFVSPERSRPAIIRFYFDEANYTERRSFPDDSAICIFFLIGLVNKLEVSSNSNVNR